MARLFWPYFLLYAFATVYGLKSRIDDNDPVLLFALDFVVLSLTLAGMLIYKLKRDWRPVSAAWRAVFVLLVIGSVCSYIYDIAHENDGFFATVILIFFIILIELPAFIMNGRVAFTPAPAALRPPQPRRA
jgi:hypothetical protein